MALAERLGADAAVEGHGGDLAAAAREFAPEGLDAALLTAGGEAADEVLSAMPEGGRVAYPHGVEPEPQVPRGVAAEGYDGDPGPEVIRRLDGLIESGPFRVHVARTFRLDEAADAHRALDTHHLGKLVLRPPGDGAGRSGSKAGQPSVRPRDQGEAE